MSEILIYETESGQTQADVRLYAESDPANNGLMIRLVVNLLADGRA